MTAFYNEIDAYCCAWLSNLMDAGHITPGTICDKSIEDIRPVDLLQFDRVHMFAGIGVWDYALNLAGWGSRQVWTGSCPCQPFSSAGKGAGFADERHLWPAWHHLIRECRPGVVFGEQVASRDGLGWLDVVQADLEGANYASWAVDLCASGLGALARRQRIYFVADTNREGWHRIKEPHEPTQAGLHAPRRNHLDRCRADVRATNRAMVGRCGTRRLLEPGVEPLAHGAASGMGRMRAAYGNAINPNTAAAVIRAYMDGEQGEQAIAA